MSVNIVLFSKHYIGYKASKQKSQLHFYIIEKKENFKKMLLMIEVKPQIPMSKLNA